MKERKKISREDGFVFVLALILLIEIIFIASIDDTRKDVTGNPVKTLDQKISQENQQGGIFVEENKIFIAKDPRTIFLMSFIVNEDSPVILYDEEVSFETANFFDETIENYEAVLIYSDDDNFTTLETNLTSHAIIYTKENVFDLIQGSYNFIAYAKDSNLIPYASAYSGKNGGLYLDNITLVNYYIDVIGDNEIYYFGNDSTELLNLQELSDNIIQIENLQEAEILLAPVYSNKKTVAVIKKGNLDYSSLAVVYSLYRDSALVSINGSEWDVLVFDENLNEQLNLVKPHNNNEEYSYMTIFADCDLIPCDFGVEEFFPLMSYKINSDFVFADRNSNYSQTDFGDEDNYFHPDLGVGRIYGYKIGTASLLMIRDYLFDQGKIKFVKKAVFATDMLVNLSLEIMNYSNPDNYLDGDHVDHLNYQVTLVFDLFGEDNVSVFYDPLDESTGGDNANLSVVLDASKQSILNMHTGHGHRDCVTSTDPSLNSISILNQRPYSPGIWWLKACGTIKHYSGSTYNLLDATLRSSALHIIGSVDTTATIGSNWYLYLPYFKDNISIGDIMKKGLADYVNYSANIYPPDEYPIPMPPRTNLGQYRLVGDPLVVYYFDYCSDFDEDGYCIYEDCNNNDPNINPGAQEICNYVDDNCNGLVDGEELTKEICGNGIDDDCDGYADTLDHPDCDCSQLRNYACMQKFCRDGSLPNLNYWCESGYYCCRDCRDYYDKETDTWRNTCTDPQEQPTPNPPSV